MDNHELLAAITALLEKELGGLKSRLDKLEAGQQEMRQDINALKAGQQQIRNDIAELTFSVGDIVNEVGDIVEDKMSKFAHELKWTQDATAQNSMDIAALKRNS